MEMGRACDTAAGRRGQRRSGTSSGAARPEKVGPGCRQEAPTVAPVGKHVEQTLSNHGARLALRRRCAMDTVYARCCGVDIHKKTAVACLVTPGPRGEPVKQVRTF